MESLRRRIELAAYLRVAGVRSATAFLAVVVVQALVPTAVGLTSGLLISRLTEPGSDRVAEAAWIAVGLGVLWWVTELSQSVLTAQHFVLAERVDAWHRDHLAELVGRPTGIAHLEDHEMQTELGVGVMKGMPGWVGYTFGSGVVSQVMIAGRLAGAGIAAGVLAYFDWPLAVVLLVASAAVRVITQRGWLRQHGIVRGLAGEGRRAGYWAEVAALPWAAKELRIFGLAEWAVGRYHGVLATRAGRLAGVRAGVVKRLAGAFVMVAVIATAGLTVIAQMVASGRVSEGELAVCLGSFWAVLALTWRDTAAAGTRRTHRAPGCGHRTDRLRPHPRRIERLEHRVDLAPAATVRHADRIVYLEGGRITETGTHTELLARGGSYADMFTLQASRFAEPTALS